MKSFQIAFMILMLILFLGGNFYVFYRIWMMIPANSFVRIIFVILAGGVLLSLILFFLANQILPMPAMSVMYKIGTSWIFIFIYLLIILLLLDFARVTNLLPLGKWMFNSWLGLSDRKSVV